MMRITLLYTVLSLGAISLAACSKQDDVSRIAQAITDIEEGIEQKSSGAVMDYLAEDFRTDKGLQRKQIQALMFYQFRRYPSIELVITNQDIQVRGEQADAMIDVLVMGGQTLLPESGNLYTVSMRWQRDDDDWLLSRIKWQKRLGS